MMTCFKKMILCTGLLFLSTIVFAQSTSEIYGKAKLLNKPDDGFRGIWYMNQRLDNEYKFKYSGGLGTYPANHYPFSVYVPEVNKTFFCYGGTDETNSTLLHEVSYFDHSTGEVARPTIVVDKATTDAHDNPVMQVDKDGYIWIFSTSHGAGRPSFIHRSTAPYSIQKFERIAATKMENGKKVPMDNFSYLQIYYHNEHGFLGLFTYYQVRELPGRNNSCRDIAWMTSPDGIHWSEWKYLATIDQGHYQSSGQQGARVGTSFNYHPHREERAGLNYRTNLYCLITDDFGKTWKTADGKKVTLPLKEIDNEALVYDYQEKGLNVYISDLNFDEKGNPVILYLTSKGPISGPEDGPRQWHTAHWTGKKWKINPVTISDNNYDAGSVYTNQKRWQIVASTETGPQPYNTGGEVAIWESKNSGKSWTKIKQLTHNSEFNHAYVRRPVNVHPQFYGFWADGHGREVSKSRLYFCDSDGNVFKLPEVMEGDMVKPLQIKVPYLSKFNNKNSVVFKKEYIREVMRKTTLWQLQNPKHQPYSWHNGALYAGVYEALKVTKLPEIYQAMLDMGKANQWRPGPRWFHADDIAICQSYVDLYRREKQPEMLRPFIDTLEVLMSRPYPTKGEIDVIKWWWCDALFMGPPALVKLGMTLKEEKYLQFNDQWFKECYDLLYDKEEHLFARDLKYVIKGKESDLREANGQKIFWSRGNGWVLGGLVRILDELPAEYHKRPFYEKLFREMVARVASLQQPDGLWRASLLDPDSYPGGEVSGSGFNCYAIAWGINNGLLNREKYLPVVEQAWISLNECVKEDGMIGWVQPVGASPKKNFSSESWEVYGTGAFLLAASEMIKLNR